MIHNLEAEQAVLGNLICYPDSAPLIASKLNQESFSHPLHQVIYLAIADDIANGRRIHPIPLHEKLKASPEYTEQQGYLAKLAAIPQLGDVSAMLAILTDLAGKRSLEAACNEALALMQTDATCDLIAQKLDAARISANSSITTKTERQVMSEIADDVRNKVEPVSTGLPRLDAAMDGGLFARRAYGMIARKKMGKTMFASTIAKNIADNGTPVLFIAAEMGDKEIQERVACRVMGSYANAFRSDYKNSEDFSRRFANAIASASDNLIYAKSAGIRFDALRQLITASVIRHKVKGFILDYWQLVGGKDGRTSEREHLDTVAQWLADFARDNDLWCLVMGQENQDGNTRGGEGMRLAFDMIFSIQGDTEEPYRWLEMKDTRYTKWHNVGSESAPAYRISEKGTHIEEL